MKAGIDDRMCVRHNNTNNMWSLSKIPLIILWYISTNGTDGFTPSTTTPPLHQPPRNIHKSTTTLHSTSTPTPTTPPPTQTRPLGSQELLMLPRQYSPNLSRGSPPFPQMSHVSTAVLSATPALSTLSAAVESAMAAHPLLRCYVEGDGEPEKRIDLFEMVREGEPRPCTFVAAGEGAFGVEDVLGVVEVEGGGRGGLEGSWRGRFGENLDGGREWCDVTKGPLWKIELHRLTQTNNATSHPCALQFTFNHAISDQTSANLLTDHILSDIASLESSPSSSSSAIPHPAVSQPMPIAMEDSVLGMKSRWADVTTDGISIDTLKYVAGKAAEGLRNPVILPDTSESDDGGAGGAASESEGGSSLLGSLTIITGNAAGGKDASVEARRSTLRFRSLSVESTSALLDACRRNGVTVSNALSAAEALTSTDYIAGGGEGGKERNYKVLQSLDMRRFGEGLDEGETMACMAGSHDLMLGPLPDNSGLRLRTQSQHNNNNEFWNLAREAKSQTDTFLSTGGPQQATRVFDFAMSISDLNNLVDLSAQSKDTQGRAYSAGIVNAGVYERQLAVRREGEGGTRGTLKVKHGRYTVEQVFFATSHARSGCLYQTSCLTVGGELQCTFHPAMPVVSEETNERFADSFVELLEIVAGTKQPSPSSSSPSEDSPAPSQTKPTTTTKSLLPTNLLLPLSLTYALYTITPHLTAYSNFFNSISEMKSSITDPSDFYAALNFWIFFAVGHPILQPILWISDVLHGTPGPMVGGLVPVLFIAGNLAVIAGLAASAEVRNAVNVLALSAFLGYVGAGLNGEVGLGDYNLALDDGVRGCPSYEEVRQPSMDGFDLERYQGLWYEQKFHDWTQFKEVYDTTLDIKLTEGGTGWIDDFAVKGPAPASAKLSWDKSPVANGAHYFLFGRVDPNDPKGILRESGFGVEFPNYIVDVKKDAETGEYTEAIQFQCLERGGVRVFEGINFMSRKPVMSEGELTAMHERSEKAGMYKYGSSPEQMHTVARRPIDAPPIDNNWQAMWRAIGVDKLLELLTESIEDGGR